MKLEVKWWKQLCHLYEIEIVFLSDTRNWHQRNSWDHFEKPILKIISLLQIAQDLIDIDNNGHIGFYKMSSCIKNKFIYCCYTLNAI